MAEADPALVAAFDAAAAGYDARFGAHPSGRLARRAVWRIVDRHWPPGSRILDIGCGTGADAVHLAARGLDVVAFDVAPAMVARTADAAARAGLGGRIAAVGADAASPGAWPAAVTAGAPFDGALSDFGVLNCLGELRPLGDALAARLRPGGLFVAVVLARFCAWETVHGLATGRLDRATRRWRGRATADLGTGPWTVWYRGPAATAAALGPAWRLRAAHPIGAALPPSWTIRAGGRLDRPGLWRAAAAVESLAVRLPAAAWWADHVALELERRAPEVRR